MLRDKYIDGLKALGEREVKQTFKYIVYSRKEGGYYYLGKSGALRFGQTVATSIPCSLKFKERLAGMETICA